MEQEAKLFGDDTTYLSIEHADIIKRMFNVHEGLLKSIRDYDVGAFRFALIDLKANPAKNDNEAMILACAEGCTALVMFLLKEPRVDPSAQDNKALHAAAGKGKLDIVKELLKSGRLEANEKISMDPLTAAINNKHVDVMVEIMTNGKAFFKRDPSHIRVACDVECEEALDILIKAHEPADRECMKEAIRRKNDSIFTKLINYMKFDVTEEHGLYLLLAIKKEYAFAVNCFLKYPKTKNISWTLIREKLKECEDADIHSMFVNSPDFRFDINESKQMREACQKRHKEGVMAALTAISNAEKSNSSSFRLRF